MVLAARSLSDIASRSADVMAVQLPEFSETFDISCQCLDGNLTPILKKSVGVHEPSDGVTGPLIAPILLRRFNFDEAQLLATHLDVQLGTIAGLLSLSKGNYQITS